VFGAWGRQRFTSVPSGTARVPNTVCMNWRGEVGKNDEVERVTPTMEEASPL
jgi:hypothetical protein